MANELQAVMALVEKATDVRWEVCERGFGDADLHFEPYDDFCRYDAHLVRGMLKLDDARAFAAALNFLRSDEFKRLREDAEKWRRYSAGEFDMGDGTTVKTHVNVAVNVWRGPEWLEFAECSPDEFDEVIAARTPEIDK